MDKKTAAALRSPLAGCAAVERSGYQQKEIFPLGKIILRGKGDDEAFLGAAAEALGGKLPLAPNTVTRLKNKAQMLWLGPEEWLLWTDSKTAAARLAALQSAFAGRHAAAVDVSDYYTIISLSGEKAPAMLAHGCPLDLREKSFPAGSCAQSHYRSAGILLHRTASGFDVQVRASFAQYVWEYFAEVSRLL